MVEEPRKNTAKTGDVLIGLPSAGFHSNGFTKVREVYGDAATKQFAVPTRVYWDDVFPVLQKYGDLIHGIVHVAGGGFTRLRDFLTEEQSAKVEFEYDFAESIFFGDIFKRGNLSDEEMYKTFNCGIGMVLAVDAERADLVWTSLRHAEIIGEVVDSPGRKVQIKSAFSEKMIEL